MGEGFGGYNPETDSSQGPGSVFDDEGRLVSQTTSFEGGRVLTVNFEYEEDGKNPTRAIHVERGKATLIRSFGYDLRGNRISEVETTPEGQLVVSNIKTCDKDGNTLTEEIQYGNEPGKVHRYVWERNGDDVSIRETTEDQET